jgi:hypothetical protein
MFQAAIEKGFINKKSFDEIVAAYNTSADEGEETLEKYMKKKKGRPGATALDVSKEELEELIAGTLSSLFVLENEEYKIR